MDKKYTELTDLEQKIMKEIGLSEHYTWYGGSDKCKATAWKAVNKLPDVLRNEGMNVSLECFSEVKYAQALDYVMTQGWGLKNTWIACTYAIQDAIARKGKDS